MSVKILDVISHAQARSLLDAAVQLPFEDGKQSAGSKVENKRNQQLTPQNATARPLLDRVHAALMQNKDFQNHCLPRDFVTVMINRYAAGDEYGWHLDSPIMHGKRTDVSFTLFLSDPSEYGGGELEIEGQGQNVLVKANVGQVAVYPAMQRHRVRPVQSGVRICAVGWVTSWVADYADREWLSGFYAEVSRRAKKEPREEWGQLEKLYLTALHRLSR